MSGVWRDIFLGGRHCHTTVEQWRIARIAMIQACRGRIVNLPSALQVLHFEDPDFGVIYVASPPAGVLLETVVAQVVSQQLGSPVPLPLDAVLRCRPEALPSLEEALFLQAKISGDPLRLTYCCRGSEHGRMPELRDAALDLDLKLGQAGCEVSIE